MSKTFKEFRKELEEHPNLKARIIAKINPLEKIKDKIADIKKRGGLTGIMKDKMQDALDKVNPMSPINKAMTLKRKEKIKKLRVKKKKLTDKAKGIRSKITSLKAKTAK